MTNDRYQKIRSFFDEYRKFQTENNLIGEQNEYGRSPLGMFVLYGYELLDALELVQPNEKS